MDPDTVLPDLPEFLAGKMIDWDDPIQLTNGKRVWLWAVTSASGKFARHDGYKTHSDTVADLYSQGVRRLVTFVDPSKVIPKKAYNYTENGTGSGSSFHSVGDTLFGVEIHKGELSVMNVPVKDSTDPDVTLAIPAEEMESEVWGMF